MSFQILQRKVKNLSDREKSLLQQIKHYRSISPAYDRTPLPAVKYNPGIVSRVLI